MLGSAYLPCEFVGADLKSALKNIRQDKSKKLWFRLSKRGVGFEIRPYQYIRIKGVKNQKSS